MNRQVSNFLNAVKAAVKEWSYSYEYYHDHNHLCVDITIDDMETWETNYDDIWNALSAVADEWGAVIDSVFNKYYLAIRLD